MFRDTNISVMFLYQIYFNILIIISTIKIRFKCFSLPSCATPSVPTAGQPFSSRPSLAIHGSQVMHEPIKDVNVLDPSFCIKCKFLVLHMFVVKFKGNFLVP